MGRKKIHDDNVCRGLTADLQGSMAAIFAREGGIPSCIASVCNSPWIIAAILARKGYCGHSGIALKTKGLPAGSGWYQRAIQFCISAVIRTSRGSLQL